MNEVHYWKNNKMLPEQYCDYLLALYQGDEEAGVSQKPLTVNKNKKAVPLVSAFLSVCLTLYVNYFTELSFNLQILLTIIFLILAAGFLFLIRDEKIPLQIALVCLAFTFLLLTVKLAEYAFPGHSKVFYPILLIHCLIWMYIGKRLKMIYFILAGVLGSCFIAYFLIKNYTMI
ncbi:hypothetical protein JOC77_001199 [Peribacillus deserti]|uniref:DUF4401 domain-containing protein n=1 Tax=Peribacillus deserti TaxID=673318 RepID=A0ABS2QGI3_9BACI|nr:hypothetical protein [Peribacillus deserti]MBM7691789.1 hypothetical protein [Peribacillus deserti]